MGLTLDPENDVFEGMDKVYAQEAANHEKNSPRCHMRPMFLDGAEDPWSDAWWECSVCGHTKDI